MPNSNESFYSAWRTRFRRDLKAAGFVCLRTEQGREWWEGTLHISWEDNETEDYCTAEHVIQIHLPRGFPFQQPVVFPSDTSSPIRDSRHQSPGSDNGVLCLWPSDSEGWLPSLSADDLLSRVRLWFGHYHQDDWPSEERPPDLHLYFPSPMRRPLMLIADDWTLPPVQVGRFGIWQKDTIRAFAGAPQAGVTMPPTFHSDRIFSSIGMTERRRDHVGLWFRLYAEPKPRHTLSELLEEIDNTCRQSHGWALSHLRSLFGVKTRGENVEGILSLGYPSGNGKEQWLFLRCNLGSKAKTTQWSQVSTLRKIIVSSFETAEVGKHALMRRTGYVARQIEGRRVLIFGQGAIGGTITLLLAKAGLQHLRIVDSDTLRPGNSVRHVGGLLFVGHDKALVSQIEALGHAPDCSIVVNDITWDPVKLQEWVQEADVVVDATANIAFSLLLNKICLDARRSGVYVAAHRRAAIGRIRIVRPGQDACLTCYESGYRYSKDYPVIPVGDEGTFIEEGCGVPTVEASAIDVEYVANWGARAVLYLLQNKMDHGNHLLTVNDVLPDAEGVFAVPGIYWGMWKPIQACDSCGSI